MDDIQDFEIRDESTENGIQHTLYCKGIARARLETWQGKLYVQLMVIGPSYIDEFRTFAHGLTEFLLTVEGAVYEHQNRKIEKKVASKKRRRRV